MTRGKIQFQFNMFLPTQHSIRTKTNTNIITADEVKIMAILLFVRLRDRNQQSKETVSNRGKTGSLVTYVTDTACKTKQETFVRELSIQATWKRAQPTLSCCTRYNFPRQNNNEPECCRLWSNKASLLSPEVSS